jgi:L-alanine-DL-glutamate epimerase-like enolase superfamily enzyme
MVVCLDSDIRVIGIESYLRADKLRVPLKFGSVIVTDSTSLIVKVNVENKKGDVAEGWGAMPLMDKWAFPNPAISHEKKFKAMHLIGEKACKMIEKHSKNSFAHPIDIMLGAKNKILKIAKKVDKEVGLEISMPVLGVLVSTSPIDAALHDAFGRVNKICSYAGYSKEYMEHDLSFYLGDEFSGKYISDYLRSEYAKEIPIFHLVGALDKLRKNEVDANDPKDGLPVSLEEWVEREGIFCLKVKLSGVDIDWDVKRTKEVADVASEILKGKGQKKFYISVDSNEMNSSPDVTLRYLHKLKRQAPLAFNNLLYVEQPTERDLKNHMFSMKKVSEIKPVLADEGVINLESFDLALKLGWSGVAVKTCKWHTSGLLYISKMEHYGIPYSVQDLTCPGLALVHSASFAARINTIKGFEYNARQYLPFAYNEVQLIHKNLFKVERGKIKTDSLDPFGLGFSPETFQNIV